jgi:uncharacterized protein (TIGR03437 family)
MIDFAAPDAGPFRRFILGRVLGIVCLLLGAATAWPQSSSFAPGVSYPVHQSALATVSADFNGDGKLDLAVASAGSSSVSIFLSKGDGTFTAGATVSIPGACLDDSLSVGDFNNDGKADLLAVCGFQSTMWVLPGLGTGQFGTPIPTNLPQIDLVGWLILNFNSVAVADFNGDGKLDVVLITSPDTVQNISSFELDLLLGNGDGTFQPPSSILPGPFKGGVVVTADFNGDGKPDLAVDSETSIVNASGGSVMILKGDGKGGFQNIATYSTPGSVVLGSMTVADVNRDGKPDLIVASAIAPKGASVTAPTLTVFTGNGDGTFKQGASYNEAGQVTAMVAADFRGTGTPDLLEELLTTAVTVAKVSETVTFAMTVRAGNGDGTFQDPVTLTTPAGFSPFWFGMAVADWNADGLPDLAFTVSPSPVTLASPSGSDFSGVAASLQASPAGELVVMRNASPPTVPVIALTGRQLQFAGVTGAANPPSQTVTVSNSGAATLNWTAASSVPWLTVTPKSGSGSATLTVAASSAGMSAGSYTGAISIAATGAANSPQSISVTFTVTVPSNLPAIAAVVNGASFLPGFASGSWVTIQGSNLSNTNPGRTWTASEIVNGNLPTSLAGTSVTIDGKPAFVYYISPTQLNVQAPSDSATGAVSVIVTNNGPQSTAFNAQLATYSPAFFLYSGTNYAIASHFPDYALVGNPNAIAGTVAAHPGDVLILWATGFGPTDPTTPAGIEVVAASSAAVQPTVTVGGLPVTVLNAVISPGSAGLYQIAIQLPATVPTGAVAIQASLANVQSPAGVLIYVAGQ